MQKITIQEIDSGQRLDKFIYRHLPSAGKSFIYKMLRKKNITLNNKKASGNEKLIVGDTVSFYFSDETYQSFHNSTSTENVSTYLKAYRSLQQIEILYEDNDVIFLNKPAGVLSQKSTPTDLSINEWLIGYLLNRKKITSEQLSSFKPSICNRLDRNTSGIVLCGVSLKGSQTLNHLIKDRLIHKYYRLFVNGVITKPAIIEGYINKNESINKVRIYNNNNDNVSYIKTGYNPITNNNRITYLEVELFTGKTHQIRAHLASIKHCLIGDAKYGNKETNRYYQNKYHIQYQLLHAYRIEFPADCNDLSQLNNKIIKANIPSEFLTILKEEKWLHGIPED